MAAKVASRTALYVQKEELSPGLTFAVPREGEVLFQSSPSPRDGASEGASTVVLAAGEGWPGDECCHLWSRPMRPRICCVLGRAASGSGGENGGLCDEFVACERRVLRRVRRVGRVGRVARRRGLSVKRGSRKCGFTTLAPVAAASCWLHEFLSVAYPRQVCPSLA